MKFTKFLLYVQIIYINQNTNIMASDDGSMLSSVPPSIESPFTKAKSVKSGISTIPPARNTQNIENRRPIIPKKTPRLPPIAPNQSQENLPIDLQQDLEDFQKQSIQ